MTKQIIMMTAAMLTASAAAYSQNDIGFTYASPQETVYLWGTEKAETYDIAIKISDPSLNGMKIKGVKVKVPGDVMSDCSGWLSRELRTETIDGKRYNVTDMSAEATIDDDVLTAIFDEPWVIDGDVYAGYSFTVAKVTDDNNSGMPVAYTREIDSRSFFIRTSRTYREWDNRNVTIKPSGICSVINVIIEGNFEPNSVGLGILPGAYAEPGQEIEVPLTIINHGSSEVTEFGYEYTLNGEEGSGTKTLEFPLPAEFNKAMNTSITLPALDELGEYELTLKLTTINSEPNADPNPDGVCNVNVMSVKPENRPLVEEFTGLACGWCPLGFVAMEYLSETFKDRFVGIAYHCYTYDPMCMKIQYPGMTSGLPAIRLNRKLAPSSPYFGNGEVPLGIEDVWEEAASSRPIAAIEVESKWLDEEKTQIEATSEIAWAMLPEDDNPQNYRIHYILVADGLEDPNWQQYNYLSGNRSYAGMPGLDMFVDGRPEVTGLIYNDVPVLTSGGHAGVAGSVSEIALFESYKHSYTFNLANAVNYNGGQIIQNKDNLKVVAILLHMTSGIPYPAYGEVLNACKGKVTDGSGISQNIVEDEIVSTQWYDLQGRRLQSPIEGLNIKVSLTASGKLRSEKVINLK